MARSAGTMECVELAIARVVREPSMIVSEADGCGRYVFSFSSLTIDYISKPLCALPPTTQELREKPKEVSIMGLSSMERLGALQLGPQP